MVVGIFTKGYVPTSIKIYVHHIRRILESESLASFVEINDLNRFEGKVDLIWHPSLAGGRFPSFELLKISVPLVLTVHGAGNFTISSKELYGNWKNAWKGALNKRLTTVSWAYFIKNFRNRLSVITVSEYAKDEIIRFLKIPQEKITSVYHGFDPELFKPVPWKRAKPKNYLLHVSDYQPKKNLDRVLEAYQSIPAEKRPPFVIISPGFPDYGKVDGLLVINSKLAHHQLAVYFQHALAFVFPSLHESFGLPIIEAMASGCPVITSSNTACREIAGDAALLIDPRSVDEIRNSIIKITNEEPLRKNLSLKGIKNVKRFDWAISAKKHIEVFAQTLNSKPIIQDIHENTAIDSYWNA